MILRTSFACILCSVPTLAQTNRAVSLGVAPGLGVTSTYTATYPSAAVGRFGFFLLTLPELTAQPLNLPGFTSNGLLRVDLNNQLLTSFWLLDGTGSRSFSVPIPTDFVFQGFSFDVQTVDVDFTTSDIAWADNDLELTIGQGVIGQGFNLVRIQPGTFVMGSPVTPLNTQPYYNQAWSQPPHQVTISLPFWIGKYEMTQGQYAAVMGPIASTYAGITRPIDTISKAQAMAFCSTLNALEAAAGRVPPGYQYRLPTEAEWEYCYRAGTSTEYYTGANLTCAQAHMSTLANTGIFCNVFPGHNSTAVVGSYPPNAWGLHDMAGNVYEYVLDNWDWSPNYPSTAVVDPYVATGAWHVIRGGSFSGSNASCRAAARERPVVTLEFGRIGFRLALAPILVP